MRTIGRYSRSWRVHAIIVAIAILIGLIVAFFARPTRGQQYWHIAAAEIDRSPRVSD